MRATFTIKNACTLPYSLPTTHAILLSTSANATSAVLLKNPIASNPVILRTEPVYFPPESLSPTPFEAAFPEILLPSEDRLANGARTHFTSVETVSFVFGLVKLSIPLKGWFAVPDAGTAGENVGYGGTLSNPDSGRWKQVLVRKVRCLREEREQTLAEEMLTCDVVWGAVWFTKRKAAATHKKFMGSLGELFTEN